MLFSLSDSFQRPRIYIQVLDNLLEWIENKEATDDIVRCLILVNFNFILYHKTFILEKEEERKIDGYTLSPTGKYFNVFKVKGYDTLDDNTLKYIDRLIPSEWNGDIKIIYHLMTMIKIDAEVKKF